MNHLMKISELVYEIVDRNPSQLAEVLSVSESKGIVLQKDIFNKKIALVDKSKYKQVKYGDIVFNPFLLWNRAVGTCFLPKGGCTSPAYIVLRPKELKTSRFLHYFFRSSIFTNSIDNIAIGSVTRRRTAPLTQILDLEFNLPSLPEQKQIDILLSALDDKIELNRRMNHTLESLAQAIFKHMFIDNPEREGWVEAKLDSICRFEYGKALKAEHRKNGNIPVFGSNGCVGYHDDYLVKGPGIIIGRKGNPGTVMFSFTDFFVIDTAFYIVPKNSTNIYWLYYALKELNLPNLGADSAVPGLNRNIAYLSEITIPSSKLCLNFESVIRPIFEKKYLNDQESNILAELRDTLLPKLMSGQVRVKL